MKDNTKSKDQDKEFRTVGVIGRFKPLHTGGALMLETICEKAEHVIIGIGSCNKYNLRNPFTARESREMIDIYLSPKHSHYSFLYIPDFAHNPKYKNGQRWVSEVLKKYGSLDAFISGDEYVRKLLKEHYKVISPGDLIPREKWLMLRGTMVRVEIAKGGNDWKLYVPKAVSVYLEKNNLVYRFRQEFGLETLSMLETCDDYYLPEGSEKEKLHTQEV
ncbi:hypothetical protein AYK26_05945 [Euryarchaeota archaeon SM23-78]|nr:MAG: hypothetical protein AYK26_05945 [Euryarchaeota archaeon SM23-78]MBW3000592.1 adenylyltransferase/cytidyltransferase family protein [Candidatus Woesearchaeota archaeon]